MRVFSKSAGTTLLILLPIFFFGTAMPYSLAAEAPILPEPAFRPEVAADQNSDQEPEETSQTNPNDFLSDEGVLTQAQAPYSRAVMKAWKRELGKKRRQIKTEADELAYKEEYLKSMETGMARKWRKQERTSRKSASVQKDMEEARKKMESMKLKYEQLILRGPSKEAEKLSRRMSQWQKEEPNQQQMVKRYVVKEAATRKQRGIEIEKAERQMQFLKDQIAAIRKAIYGTPSLAETEKEMMLEGLASLEERLPAIQRAWGTRSYDVKLENFFEKLKPFYFFFQADIWLGPFDTSISQRIFMRRPGLTDADRTSFWKDFVAFAQSEKAAWAGPVGTPKIEPNIFEEIRDAHRYYMSSKLFNLQSDLDLSVTPEEIGDPFAMTGQPLLAQSFEVEITPELIDTYQIYFEAQRKHPFVRLFLQLLVPQEQLQNLFRVQARLKEMNAVAAYARKKGYGLRFSFNDKETEHFILLPPISKASVPGTYRLMVLTPRTQTAPMGSLPHAPQ